MDQSNGDPTSKVVSDIQNSEESDSGQCTNSTSSSIKQSPSEDSVPRSKRPRVQPKTIILDRSPPKRPYYLRLKGQRQDKCACSICKS